MAKSVYILVVILIIVLAGTVAGAFFYFNYKSTELISCTMEAKLCTDGSYVSRQGPNCEFAQCPIGVSFGGIKGKVTVGPI